MPVRLSIWRAALINLGCYHLYKGNAIAGHVNLKPGPDGPAWYVKPAIAGRKGSRIGRATAIIAARSYFGADAADAVEFATDVTGMPTVVRP